MLSNNGRYDLHFVSSSYPLIFQERSECVIICCETICFSFGLDQTAA